APPNQDVAHVKHSGGQPLFGIVDSDRLHSESRLRFQVFGDAIAEEVFVRLLLRRLTFVPDNNVDRLCTLGASGLARRTREKCPAGRRRRGLQEITTRRRVVRHRWLHWIRWVRWVGRERATRARPNSGYQARRARQTLSRPL